MVDHPHVINPNEPIPLTFTHNNKERKCTLQKVSGSAQPTWHLMENNYYRGSLVYFNNSDDFEYHDQKNNEMKDFSIYFGAVVISWYE